MRAVVILAFSLLLGALSLAGEPDTYHFDIAVQSLSSALNEFARQSHQQILFAPDLVAQKLSSPVRGDMQSLAALKLLLKDSALKFKEVSSGAILVGNPDESHAASLNAPSPGTAPQPATENAPADLASVTVEGTRQREVLRRRLTSYISAITLPNAVALGRWERYTPLCPLVAGVPRPDGEYLLKKLSQIGTAAGAPLAPQHCKPNLYAVLTSQPDALIKSWSNRDPWMFDDDSHQGGTIVHRFLNATTAARTWYNVRYTGYDGLPEATMSNTANAGGLDLTTHPWASGIVHDLWSVIVIIDARRAKGVGYNQLASYIAMIGLAQIRLDAQLGDAPTILQLFSDPEKAPSRGLSTWDRAFLKALYNTNPSDKSQRSAIARSMTQELAP